MAITLDGTNGITISDLISDAGLTADGVSFASGAPANTLVTTDAGNVGIGTSSPNSKIDLGGGTSGQTFLFSNTATNTGARLAAAVSYRSGSGYTGKILESNIVGAFDDIYDVRFFTANIGASAERMRIDSSGNVGIGTTVMNGRLNVSGTTFINDGGGFALSVPSNSQGGNGVVFRGDGNGASRFWQIVSNTSSYGLLDFQVSASNTNASYSSKMVIDSSGNVLVAATSLASGVNGKLYVNGLITGAAYQTRAGAVGAYGGNSFNINWTGSPQLWIDNTNIGTFAFTSDYRIKKNIETNTAPALERIAQIRPVTYEFANYGELFKEDGIAREGFIAHELQAVIPSAV
jgi:hypothetical protein